MPNIHDYIKWRGDLTMEVSPFNDVDNVILSLFTYIDLNGTISEVKLPGGTTIRKLTDYMVEHGFTSHKLGSFPKSLLADIGKSKRFGDIRVFSYLDMHDEHRYQFAALAFEITQDTTYVGFRGTDESIVGWKEDFMMSFTVCQAQWFALSYLEYVIASDMNRQYFVGGHSKGGNLAVFAAANCHMHLHGRLARVYNNDGPDLCEDVISKEVLESIADKTVKIVPEFCVVGMIFNSIKELKVIKSDARTLIQHDLLTWQCIGTEFEEVEDIHKDAKAINIFVDTWIENTTPQKRKEMIDYIFGLVEETGIKSLPQFLSISPIPQVEELRRRIREKKKRRKH